MRNLLLPLAPWLLVAAAVAVLSALFARWGRIGAAVARAT